MIEMCLRIGLYTLIHPKNAKSKKEIDEKNKIRWCCFQTKLWKQHACSEWACQPKNHGILHDLASRWDLWCFLDFEGLCKQTFGHTSPPKMEKYDNNKPKNKRINTIINQYATNVVKPIINEPHGWYTPNPLVLNLQFSLSKWEHHSSPLGDP